MTGSVPKVLLIADDTALLAVLAEQLALNDEFVVETAKTATCALQAIMSNCFDIVLLDDDLSDTARRGLCRKLHDAGVRAPVIILSAGNETPESALDVVAVDCIAKPFRVAALLTRMRELLRRYPESSEAVLAIGPYLFDSGAKHLVDSSTNRKIRLTEKEAAIISCLYQAKDRTETRENLLYKVWGYHQAAMTHTLETHVYRLRQKIEPAPSRAVILVTVANGYRLVV